MNLLELATLVRDEAERWARDVGYEAETLLMQCAVCSVAFVAAAEAVGIEAEIANGFYLDEVASAHFWAFAWERGVHGTRLVDLTLTQYETRAPRAAVFSARDPEVKRYALISYGAEAWRWIRETDHVEAVDLIVRVRLRVRAHLRAMGAPVPVEAAAP